MLTKEQLTDAHEQGLSISTRNGNIKIVCILNDVYGVNHFNSNKVYWWLFEQFEKQEAKIEQFKPKYNGRAVKCDNLEQIKFVAKNEGSKLNIEHYTFNDWNQCIIIETKEIYELHRTDKLSVNPNLEIISFSDYCKENGITEPKWIQGFEIGKQYNDVVMVSDDNKNWCIDLLRVVNIDEDDNFSPYFNCLNNNWKYCRYPRKNEINEIKFVN